MNVLVQALHTKNKHIMTQQSHQIRNKIVTEVYDLVPHKKNYNYMMDLFHLPEDKKRNRYLWYAWI